MNVTIVQGAFLPVPPVAGGAVEKLWFDLGREFARRGLQVTHLSRTWPGLPPQGELDGVAHRRIGGFDYPRNRWLAKAMDLVYSLRCLRAVPRSDVIVTNTFFLPVLLTALSWFRRRGVVYVSVHRYPQGQMALYRKVDRLQCVSTVVADAVREQTPSVSGLVKVVPNYIPARLSDDEVERSWPQRRREVLFVGRVHPEKGIALLVDAWAAVAPGRRQGWSLRIVGPHETAAGGGGGEFLASVQARARAAGIVVDWSGPIYDRDELARAYRDARLFVYPSVAARGEAFPLAPLEAMSRGCPVVTSDLACFADFIEPGVNADTFALGTSGEPPAARAGRLAAVLESLIGDDERLRRRGRAGLRTAQTFTLDRVADVFVDDFTALARR